MSHRAFKEWPQPTRASWGLALEASRRGFGDLSRHAKSNTVCKTPACPSSHSRMSYLGQPPGHWNRSEIQDNFLNTSDGTQAAALMSAQDQISTPRFGPLLSAVPSIADIRRPTRHVRFVPRSRHSACSRSLRGNVRAMQLTRQKSDLRLL